jgi:5'-3' exonuclease
MFRTIFAWEKNRTINPTYTALTMVLACLKQIGCHPDDLIILALDSPKGSWRKEIDSAYKSNRKEQREKHDINWNEMFGKFKWLIDRLKDSTSFIPITIDKMEADDIISVACRYYKDVPIIIVSSDSDYEQLAVYKHVKLFSPISKKYKHVPNPSKILENKIKKETTDNLITEIITQEDYDKRKMLVNLLELPCHIEEKVLKVLEYAETNPCFNLEELPFPTLQKRFMEIYNCEPEKEIEIKKKKPIKKLKLLTI